MTFAELHRPGDPFVLPNAWDVASARLLAEEFPAVGTTSLGVAAAHGLPDATGAARDAVVGLARALAVADLRRPVSVDVEDGFDADPARVAALVASLGVDGVNVEDATDGELVDPAAHARKIRAIKDAAPRVFVNARTDVLWLRRGAVAAAAERLARYVDAGADGVFVPGDLDARAIDAVVRRVDAPLNVLASPTLTRRTLADLGVARISTGSLLYRAALAQAVAVAVAVRDGDALPTSVTYARVQELAAPSATTPSGEDPSSRL